MAKVKSSDEDDELSSDGERSSDGGYEYASQSCEMPAEYGLWGEPGDDPDAYGGGGYD